MKTVIRVLIIANIALWGFVIFLFGKDSGYRDGQIDALNGKYKYKIEVTQDTNYVIIQKP